MWDHRSISSPAVKMTLGVQRPLKISQALRGGSPVVALVLEDKSADLVGVELIHAASRRLASARQPQKAYLMTKRTGSSPGRRESLEESKPAVNTRRWCDLVE